MAKNKQAFLVIPIIDKGHHICEAFDALADALHDYASSKKSYVYDEMRFNDDNKNSTGCMLITLICENPSGEIEGILKSTKSKNSYIQFFKKFDFDKLLSAEQPQIEATIVGRS